MISSLLLAVVTTAAPLLVFGAMYLWLGAGRRMPREARAPLYAVNWAARNESTALREKPKMYSIFLNRMVECAEGNVPGAAKLDSTLGMIQPLSVTVLTPRPPQTEKQTQHPALRSSDIPRALGPPASSLSDRLPPRHRVVSRRAVGSNILDDVTNAKLNISVMVAMPSNRSHDRRRLPGGEAGDGDLLPELVVGFMERQWSHGNLVS
ncbi:hypothetical protein FRB93_004158 [Tulasnella sp. JGI-2019a]|nr:hypothetical protein FRB93_004158 [Tulasnella sp. JGI-2019a]